MAWATIEQLDVLLGSRADDFTTEEKQAALDLATTTLDAVTICEVALDESGVPIDARFQLATATLASQLLTAAPVVVGGTITSESLGDYRYTIDGARSTAAVLDVANDPNLVALIGWCLPQSNYTLTTSQDYVVTCDCASFGVACDCRYSAHGYGCPCPIDYRSTHYPYPARSVR